ncbi:MAG: hypothetical protein L3J16_01285 [Anaerolineales bacterium]|nr:hypothetical protein [Anaerolineales bacterium]
MTQTPQRLVATGKKAFEQGDFDEAIQLFAQAAVAYTEAGQTQDALEAKNNLSVALLQANRAQDALDAVTGTDRIFAEANDPLRQAMALGNQAAALQALGKNAEALALYEESGRIFGEIGEGDLQAMVAKSAATINLQSGKLTDTAFSMLESLNATKKPNLFQRFLKFMLRLR